MPKYIIKDIEISSIESEKEDSYDENSNKGNSDDENHIIMYSQKNVHTLLKNKK